MLTTMSSWSFFLLLALVLVSGFFSSAYLLAMSGKRKRDRLPPGPRGLPILGSLHMLGKLPHRDLHRLAKDYGSIMFMRLGLVPTVLVSSPRAAEEFLKTHDLVFASRPYIEAAKYMSCNRRGLALTEYGPYWRKVRKLCTLELLSNLKIDSFKSMRREELSLLIKSIKDAAKPKAGVAIDLSEKVATLSADMTCRMVFGKKYSDSDWGFKGTIQEGMRLASAFNIADFIPYIGELDLQGLRRRMKACNKIIDNFFDKIIDEHMNAKETEHRDFIDVMLSLMKSDDTEFQLDRTNVKALMNDMLAAAMDTSSTSIEWTLSELLKHPEVMNKLQKELESKIGMERVVEESDLVSLDYLEMVVKESLRLHPVAPLLIPHESMDDCIVDGFYIPKKTRVIINAWAIGRDPDAWHKAEEFYPERFIYCDVDIKGRDFQLIPFGSGRRGCPGLQLGFTVVRLVVAQLVHCFAWELPNGISCSELDMEEEFGLTVPRANHLLAIPTYRLSDDIA
ncbi:cytochrome P450 71AU50-like [Tasmannia lanceolata]|uniref:cytochrome P450 71AU50-like n=1 Tax=Tasmannia lanceolata TaxID=3420 RepID=UPI004064B1B6